jgi:hypothetical protein
MTERPRQRRSLPALLLLLVGCTQLEQGVKYFFTPCAGSGPEQSTDFELTLPPFDLDRYYAELEPLKSSFQFEELERVSYAGRSHPIYWIRRPGPSGAPRLLIVAGVHGDERAALLAVPRFLRRLADAPVGADAWDVSVIVPANPVGAAHTSRYNAGGCDINRDFGAFATPEARAILEVVDRYSPDQVVATHEGPQQGFFLIATSVADAELARAMVDAVAGAGVSLAQRSFLGLRLGTPGLSLEGRLMALGKQTIRLGSLGTFLESRQIATYTTESSWNSEDFESRTDRAILSSTVRASLARTRPSRAPGMTCTPLRSTPSDPASRPNGPAGTGPVGTSRTSACLL